MSSVRKFHGLKLSPRPFAMRAVPPVPDINGEARSWLRRCRVGDNQGQVGACTCFTLGDWREIMEGVEITNDECVALYRQACADLGQGDEGLTHPQAFAAAQKWGWFKGMKLLEVNDTAMLAQQPLISGWDVNDTMTNVNYFGCFDHSDAAVNSRIVGGHSLPIVACGQIDPANPAIYVHEEQHWGLKGGGGNLGIIFQQEWLFNRFCRELYAIVNDDPVSPSDTCNVSTPAQTPPYDGDWLAAQGNAEECPNTKAGAGVVRLAIVGTNWLIGHLLDQGYDIDGQGNAAGKCFDADNGRYHFVGYSYEQREDKIVKVAPGVWFPYRWVTYIWFEYRKR